MNIKKYLGKIPKIWLASFGFWSMAAIGWIWADITINISFYYVYEDLKLPSFFSTLVFLPVSFLPLRLYIFIMRKHSETDWGRRIDSHITKLSHFLIVLSIVFQICSILTIGFIGAFGGGLDIMLDKESDIVISSIFFALPILIAVTIFSILLFLIKKKEDSNRWIAFPTIYLCGTLIFKILFLLMGIES